MQRFPKTLFILSLSVLAGAVSLLLITASVVFMSPLYEHWSVPLPAMWQP